MSFLLGDTVDLETLARSEAFVREPDRVCVEVEHRLSGQVAGADHDHALPEHWTASLRPPA